MKMKPTYLALLLVAVYVNVFASMPPALTPKAVREDTRRIGAKAVVQKLYSANRWQALLKNVESGNASWLELVGELAEGTDAGTSEDLQVSLATALPKNPRGVLIVAGTKDFLSIRDICGAPFIEPEHAFLMRYLKNSQRALVALNDPTVEQKRIQCLSRIQQVLADEKDRED
jgi:hypothetical protein